MPFDFDNYQSKCENLSPEQLHREWENYTRQISGGATSTATAVLFSPLTAGISLVGLGLSAPRIHNARKKRAIIEAKLKTHGQNTNTRKRDVIAPMAISGTIGGLTLGLAGPGADIIAGEAIGKGAEYAAAHVVLDATGAVIENKHDGHSKHKADQRMAVQYQNFQKQFIQEQAAQGIYIQPKPLGYQPGQQNLPGQQVQLQQPGNQTYQPLPPSQDQKYEYVPVPAASNGISSSQPAFQQQNFVPGGQPLAATTYQQLPPYSPIQSSGPLVVALNTLVHDTSRRQSMYQPSPQAHPSPCPTPLPVYSQSQNISDHQVPMLYSQPDSSVITVKPATEEQSPKDADSKCKSSIVDFPLDVFELPAELVTSAIPDDDSIAAPPSMEDEILILKARILQMEIEKRGGIIDIAPARDQRKEQCDSEGVRSDMEISIPTPNIDVGSPASYEITKVEQNLAAKSMITEQAQQSPSSASVDVGEPAECQTTQIEVKLPVESDQDFFGFEPLSFYPPPPASPAPSPALLPDVPILHTVAKENVSVPVQAQTSHESLEHSQVENDSRGNDATYTLKVLPIRQQTSPLPAPDYNHQQSAPRHASLAPIYQSRFSVIDELPPALPTRPQSQILQNLPVHQQQHQQQYPAPCQIQAPQLLNSSHQNQYVPQLSGVSGGYNPQTYSPMTPQIQQQTQVSALRPQSAYQPLSFPTSQNDALSHQNQQEPQSQQQHAYMPPPPPRNPQQQRPAPTPRPQSVYQPQPAAPSVQNTIQASSQQQPASSARPQSMYQPHYPPPAQASGPPTLQHQQVTTGRPQSVYQPLQFSISQVQSPSLQAQQQPIYNQPPKASPISRQDSGYYSIPPSRHASSASFSIPAMSSPSPFTPSTSNYSTPQILSPQSTGSAYQGRSSSVSTMGIGLPMSPLSQPQAQMQAQPYFPPPPGSHVQTQTNPLTPGQNDYFGSKVGGYNNVGENQAQPQRYIQGPNQQQSHYQSQAHCSAPSSANQGGATQGWQWGMPAPQPNYGAPPPIPQPWK